MDNKINCCYCHKTAGQIVVIILLLDTFIFFTHRVRQPPPLQYINRKSNVQLFSSE